jgi:hypothetical protein
MRGVACALSAAGWGEWDGGGVGRGDFHLLGTELILHTL